MTHLSKCPECGAPLQEGRLEGLCPACAWNSMFSGAADADPASEPQPQLRLPGHTILGELARGGMGIVYRARQAEPDRVVALKMLLPQQLGSSDARARFQAEVRAIASLDHPAILPVYQIGELDGLPWFTMKLAGGGSLAERRDRLAGDWRGIAQLAVTLADAVQFAHEHGILHRDLKPANVLFDETGRSYLSDFGLAKFLDGDAGLTATHATLGTPGYLAPEALHGGGSGVTTAADIYGLGAILYELLTGRPPFQSASVASLLRDIAERNPDSPSLLRPGVPPDLEVICLKCLAKEPAARYRSAGELAADLRCWLEGRPIAARAASMAERCRAWCRRNPSVATLSALLAAGALVGGSLLVAQNMSLEKALHRSEDAERRARNSLRESLRNEARALGQSEWLGRRFHALATLQQAASLAGDAPPAERMALRNEAIAALARPDLRWVHRWPLAALPGENATLFAPDLESFAVAAPGGCEWVSVSNRTLLSSQRISLESVPHQLQWSGDQQTILAAYPEGRLQFWAPWEKTPRFEARGAGARVLAADAHAKRGLRAWSFPGEGVKWSDSNELPPGVLTPQGAAALRFDPDGRRLALVVEQAVELWALQPPRRLWTTPMPMPVPRLDWHPDGSRLLAASRWEDAIHLLDATNGATLLRYHGHAIDPVRFAFHPGGRMAASVGRDGTLRLWDTLTGRDEVVTEAIARTMQFSADGRRLACTVGTFELGILELAPGVVFREFDRGSVSTGVPDGLLCDPAGRQIFVASSTGVRRWSTESGAFTGLLPVEGPERIWAQMDREGGRLLFGRRRAAGLQLPLSARSSSDPLPAAPAPWRDGLTVLDINARGTWLVRVADAGMELWPKGDAGAAKNVGRGLGGLDALLSPDDRWVAIQHRQAGAVRVVDADTGAIAADLAVTSEGAIPRSWWTPDGRALLTSSLSGFEMWEAGTWRQLHSWPAETGGERPGPSALSPDGRWLAIEETPDVFLLLSLPSGERLARLDAPRRAGAAHARFSPDGSRLWVAAQGPRVFEWNLAQLRKELAALGLDWKD